MIHSKGKKTTQANANKTPLRIVLKCSWSGSRIQAPDTLVASSTLAELIYSVASQLPALFSDSSDVQPAILYLRTTVWKKDWPSTIIAQLLGDDVSGSVLFTLNLPGSITPTISGPVSATESELGKNADDKRIKIDRSSSKVTMDIDNETTTVDDVTMSVTDDATIPISDEPTTPRILSPNEAIQKVLEQNFDVASKECLFTILKLVDNIISKPQDPKVRSIRLSNPTIHDKIRSKKGGLEILFSVGFTIQQSLSMDSDPKLTLSSQDENISVLLYTRELIRLVLVKTLDVSMDDIPPLHQPARETSRHENPSSQTQFDPFKPFAFNVQSAAVGAPDPTSIVPDGVVGPSLTEQRLDQLKKKQLKIEQDLFRKYSWTLQDRKLVAYPPMPVVGAIVTVSSKEETATETTFVGSSKGDASLIAGRLKRLEDERKKREEGGFTTSAMREIDKLMNTKIYTHTQVRIDFPNGAWVSAKFLPHEKISTVKDTLRSVFISELSAVQFDLYVTPPRRLLIDANTLTDESLVPAAKIRLAWKDGTNSMMSSFIRSEFFGVDIIGMDSKPLAYPDAVSIVETNQNVKAAATDDDKRAGNDAKLSSELSKEDELVRRMLGKQSSFLRPKGQR